MAGPSLNNGPWRDPFALIFQWNRESETEESFRALSLSLFSVSPNCAGDSDTDAAPPTKVAKLWGGDDAHLHGSSRHFRLPARISNPAACRVGELAVVRTPGLEDLGNSRSARPGPSEQANAAGHPCRSRSSQLSNCEEGGQRDG